MTVDGRPAAGWVHKRTLDDGRIIFLTEKDGGRVETYRITQETGKGDHVVRCRDLTAPRFPAFPIGDVNPPCFGFVEALEKPSQTTTEPPGRNLRTGPRFVEFTADAGERLRASW